MSEKNLTDTPIHAGIVGCGGIAQVCHLPVLKKHPQVEIQAICDLDTSKAAVLADKFDVKGVYEDIEEMLQNEKIDVVFIMTPNNLHLPMSLISLEHGVHVFLEKPAGRDASEAERIHQKAQAVGKKVMVGMQNRFRQDVLTMKQFLDDQELGKLFYLKVGWLQAFHRSFKPDWVFQKNVSGGGVVLDLGIQVLDLAWFLLRKPQIKTIKATAFNPRGNIQVEYSCFAHLSFQEGVFINFEVSWDYPIAQDHFYLEAIGSKGIATLNPLKLQKLWHGQVVNISPEMKESKISYYKKGYENEVYHFINHIMGKTPSLGSSIEDAVSVQKMIDGIYTSLETGKEVTLS
ncbi:MAG: Gfo/Idh/MocA family oxidoreductase [Calditrichia bacterium]